MQCAGLEVDGHSGARLRLRRKRVPTGGWYLMGKHLLVMMIQPVCYWLPLLLLQPATGSRTPSAAQAAGPSACPPAAACLQSRRGPGPGHLAHRLQGRARCWVASSARHQGRASNRACARLTCSARALAALAAAAPEQARADVADLLHYGSRRVAMLLHLRGRGRSRRPGVSRCLVRSRRGRTLRPTPRPTHLLYQLHELGEVVGVLVVLAQHRLDGLVLWTGRQGGGQGGSAGWPIERARCCIAA